MNYQVWVLETVLRLMIVLSILVYATFAANYTVGGKSGWSLDSDMQAWSSSKTFKVGDTLVFLYSRIHNVLEVNEFAYDACVSSNPFSIDHGTSAIIKLDTPGTRYFICREHCKSGLKIKIVVTSTTTSNAPPTAPASPTPRYSPPYINDYPSAATNTPVPVISLVMAILMVINSSLI
ncbi:hypothetical protein MKW92_051886 [Papaver armeniacum]|nr:hypothetical protein MKW92_051886 [Papaver armeniacum]